VYSLRHKLRRTAQKPDDVKVSAFNAAGLVAALQLLGRVMGSEKNSTGHADDVATANGHNTPQSISLAIFLQITEVKASIRKAYERALSRRFLEFGSNTIGRRLGPLPC
jgi:hypothetical protein